MAEEHARGTSWRSGADVRELARRTVESLRRTEWRPDPPRDDDRVWRYMELAKFLAVLQRRRLFLPNVPSLRDKFEGSLTESEHRRRSGMRALVAYSPVRNQTSLPALRGLGGTQDQANLAISLADRKKAPTRREPSRDQVFVSCWYVSNDESEAMWRLYGAGLGTVAVTTTFGDLKQALCQHEAYLVFSRVAYILGTREAEDQRSGPLGLFFRKLPSFVHEQELRILAHTDPGASEPPSCAGRKGVGQRDGGLALAVRLSSLVQSVIAAPNSPPWVHQVIRGALAQSHMKHVKVTSSSLDQDALF